MPRFMGFPWRLVRKRAEYRDWPWWGKCSVFRPTPGHALAWPLDPRVEGEFDPNPARLSHDEMDLRTLARELRGEFHDNAGPAGNAIMQGVQSRSIGDCEGKMMKADVGAPVECDRSVRRFDPP